MKPDSARYTDYQARMQRVLAYLHDNLDQPLNLERLAEVAHLSPYHWHRVYHALYGEPVAATLRRLRLGRASGELANGTRSVAEIARRWGYPNVQSFTRAFRSAYGMSPSQYREQGPHRRFEQSPEGSAEFPIEVREVPRVVLAGLAHRGSYMNIGRAFEASWLRLQAAGLVQPSTRWLAEYRDDPFAVPERQLDSRAGLSLPADAAAPAPLQRFELGGQRCAVLTHRGPYASMRAAYRWLYGTWLVASGEPLGHRPVFEEYLNNPRDTAPNDLLSLIYLPLG